jgi:hypothetical protein
VTAQHAHRPQPAVVAVALAASTLLGGCVPAPSGPHEVLVPAGPAATGRLPLPAAPSRPVVRPLDAPEDAPTPKTRLPAPPVRGAADTPAGVTEGEEGHDPHRYA